MSQRHRLAITVSMPLYEELCRLAGPRGISRWMEDAAWLKIRASGGESGRLRVSGAAEGEPRTRPGLPPPPWCWSPLRPSQIMESGEDLVDL
ncbi:MAG: hypothetical protein OXG47_03075 [bacterium]|nr:hypothetical protein [bacterium]